MGAVDTATLRRVIRHVCRKYKIPQPRLKRWSKDLTKARFLAACWDGGIGFDPQHRTLKVLAHELAHWVCDEYGYYERTSWHGPRWLGIYLWIMDYTRVMPLSASVPSARKAGLKFRRTSECAPGKLKRYLE